MKFFRHLSFLFAALSLLSLLGCTNTEKYPPDYDKLAGLIGKTKEVVIAELALQDDPQEVMKGVYVLPKQVSFRDTLFDVHLYFDIGSNFELFKISYTASFTDDPKDAAQKILSVAKTLSKVYKETCVREETAISEISEQVLIDKFSQNIAFEENNFWDLTNSSNTNINQYIAMLESSENWQTVYGRFNLKPHYYLDCTVGYRPDENTAFIVLEYSVSAYRGDGDYKETDHGIIS